MEKKEIKIDPSLFSLGGSSTSKGRNGTKKKDEQKKKDMLVNVGGKSVKELLLQKLKEYKKSKTKKNTLIQTTSTNNKQLNQDFLDKIKKKKKSVENNVNMNEIPYFKNENETVQRVVESNILSNPQNAYVTNGNRNELKTAVNIQPDPKYGILKNGTKPTIRETMKTINNDIKNSELLRETTISQLPLTKPAKVQEKINYEVERKMRVGKNNRTRKVGIFIKNSLMRKECEDSKLKFKKENIRTVKNYLKKNNLIKFGTDAPNDMLRYMYVNSKVLGDVKNNNSTAMYHNFLNDES